MHRLKLFLPLLVFFLLAIFLGLGLKNDPSHLPSALINKPFPAFSLPELKETERMLTVKDLVGQPFLLNVWATWCPSCRVEHPYLVELARRGINIVGLNYKDEDEKAIKWLEHFEDPYSLNIVDSDGRLGLDLGVYGAPETFVVGADGVIKYKHVGVLNESIWNEHIAQFFK